MGNALAKNVATNAINQALNITNNTITNCTTSQGQSQNIKIGGNNCCNNFCFTDSDCKSGGKCQFNKAQNIGICTGGTSNCLTIFKNINITQSQISNLNGSCLETGTTSSSISSQISQAASQLAQAVNQSLDLNPGSTDAVNIAQNIVNLMAGVQNIVQNQCFLVSVQKQGVNLLGSCGGKEVFNNIIINQEQFGQAVQSCVFSNSAITDLTTAVTQSISQKATATVENSLGLLLLAIIIVAIVFLFLSLEAAEWIVIILIIVIVAIAIYLIVAKIKKWWPFNHTYTPPPNLPKTGNLEISKTAVTLDKLNPSITYAVNNPTNSPISYKFTIAVKKSDITQDLSISVDSNPEETFMIHPGDSDTVTSTVYSLSPGYHAIVLSSTSGITVNSIEAIQSTLSTYGTSTPVIPGGINLTAGKGWNIDLTGPGGNLTLTATLLPTKGLTIPKNGTLTTTLGGESTSTAITANVKTQPLKLSFASVPSGVTSLQFLSTVPISVSNIVIS